MKNVDESLEAFKIFKAEIEHYIENDLNESDTRSKMIDALLIDVLGWKEVDIKREGKVESGYFDYKISAPGVLFVIEAKRSFKKFIIPSNHKKAKIKSLLAENKEVFGQIRGYASDLGIPYGLITNGKQFIISKYVNIDGNDWRDNNCLVFNGLEDIQSRFVEFYDNLSKYSLTHNGGFIYDLPVHKTVVNTILNSIVNRDKELVRNSLSAKLTPLLERIFGEIFNDEVERDENFIKKCFVENIETKKNREEIDRLFADKAPQLSNVVGTVNSKNLREQISKEILEDEIKIKNITPPKPIVIVGSKGAGKSTFINHLFSVESSAIEHDHLIVYVDLEKYFEAYEDFNSINISKVIVENLQQSYDDLKFHSLKVLKRIYIDVIRENDEGIWQYDKENNQPSYQDKLSKFLEKAKNQFAKHLERTNKYLIRERRKRIIVIIDNADQFPSVVQEKVFLYAHSLSKSSLCGTIISLREGYYYKWRNSPPFDAFESNVYHITAPKYSEVLTKRIDFTLEKLEAAGVSSGENDMGFRIEVPNQAVIEFMSGLKDSLFSESNQDLIDFLNYTTYPNIREGLKTFKQFLISGHTNVSDYIIRERFKGSSRRNRQVIPIFEFVKAIGLQNKLYYNSEFSVIHNLLLPPKNSNDHFLKLYLLQELEERLSSKGAANRYIQLELVLEKFLDLGYRSNTLVDALTFLFKINAIDTDEQLSDIDWSELPQNVNVAITSKGHYYLTELVGRFHYLDLILQDTPIIKEEHFEKMKAAFPKSDDKGKRTLDKRLETVLKFVAYLKEQDSEQPRNVQTVYGSISQKIEARLKNDKQKILNRIKNLA